MDIFGIKYLQLIKINHIKIMKLKKEDLLEIAREEKILDNLSQCGKISQHFPEVAAKIAEAKDEIEDFLIENGIELGSVY